jgi:D-amino peptidase
LKIYILADMEGISGIRRMVQVQRDSSEYEEGRRLMMEEMNVAVDAAYEAGATEVVVCDTHGGGGQVRVGDMDERAVYEMPGMGRLMPSLDESFDGVILLGHHAKAGTENGFLDHTMSSASWYEYRINDLEVGEIGIEAAFAGHYGVPVVMVAGDEATGVEANALLDGVECAIVKWGIGRNKAKCLSIPHAHKVIRETTLRAVSGASDIAPFQPELPATIQLTLYRSDMAEDYALNSGVERINARTVRKTIDSLLDVCRW